MSEGRLIRQLLPFERNFTQLPNAWLRDPKLSFKARGLLALLMTHDEGWKVTIKQLADDASRRDGIDSIRAAVEELEAHGYLIRRPSRRGGQFTADDWEITDPTALSDPALIGYAAAGRKTALENPTRRRTALENPTRTALENPTALRTPEEDIKSSQGDPGTGARECKTSPTGSHNWLSSGWCEWCPTSQAVSA